MPLELADLPADVQVAFFLYGFLEDKWEGNSGTYMGKIWTLIPFLFDMYSVDEPKVMLYYMKTLEGITIEYRGEEQTKRRKAEERKSSGGGKNFTHSVKG